jgi:DNA modification methylase
MSKINMTEEELTKLWEAVNDSAEPQPELAGRLFPSFMEKLAAGGKFDFETLNRIRIPTLEYAGKRQEGVILAGAALLGQSAPLQILRTFGEPAPDAWRNLIVQGDNLQFLKTVFLNQDPLIKDKVKGKVKLFYNDPPFATKSDFQSKDGATSYSDKIESAEFLEDLRERLIFMRETLAEDGSIYLHLDQKMSHYIKLIMDEVFGKENMINEIIWRRAYAHNDPSRCGVIHDSILYYSISQDRIWNKVFQEPSPEYIDQFFDQYDDVRKERYNRVPLDAPRHGNGGNLVYEWKGAYPSQNRTWSRTKDKMEELDKAGLIHYPKSGMPRLKRFESEYEGIALQDIWLDIRKIHNQSNELTDYPTQKPETLLERIIRASSNPGDLVMDIFGGSGTMAAVAEKLDRRWITCDFGKHAIYTMQKRILNIEDSRKLVSNYKEFNQDIQRCEKCNCVTAENEEYKKCKECGSIYKKEIKEKFKKYSLPPKPLAVVSVGAYDFSRVMDLRKNKEAYVAFVLALFGIPREEKDFAEKYRLDGIYAEKDGDPVEIFPVWEDDYLYHVRLDEDYLKQILIQSRGRIRGNYWIIVPETCTIVGDLTLKNQSGEPVSFKLLKFPYKILEEASRNFTLEEQPNSPDNINSLVSSVGFYFHDDVAIEARKTPGGLTLSRFSTPVVNREGKTYEGLEGLSLVLIDLNYDGKVFNLHKAAYRKEIGEDGCIGLEGVTEKTAVIAIDRHGNESKPWLVK